MIKTQRLPVLISGWVLGLGIGMSAIAHHPGDSPDSAECRAPVRPADDQNDKLWAHFLGDVDTFRQCINDFVRANQTASDIHHTAARDAVERWNIFVHHSLNAPEDFPWPPASAQSPATE